MIAAPWKRLAASATDALLILLAHVALQTVVAALWPGSIQRLQSALFFLSPVACWLYVWIGWWRGATIGKKLWRIRVAREDGTRPTFWQAGSRCFGYALASLPAKAGLLPILWDARRRGWHDKLARTVVVEVRRDGDSGTTKESGFPLPEIVPARRPAPPLLDFAAARRGWPLALLGYLFCVLLLTFPHALNISTHLIGKEGDSSVFLWNYWFFERALNNGQSLFSTDLLFHPRGAPLLFHTMNWFNCALAYVLLKFFTLTTTYNLLFYFSLSSSAFSAYWLCAAWTRHRLTAFIAALVFGFSPYFWAHGLGHMNLIAAQFLPLLVLYFYAALTTQSRRYAIGAGIALALCGYCDFQLALFGFIWLGCLLAGLHFGYASNSTLLRRRLMLVAITLATGALLLAPLLVPALLEQRGATYMNNYRQIPEFRAVPIDFVRFNRLTALSEDKLPTIENIIGLGWMIALLTGLAVWKFHRIARLWIVSAAVFGVLACGASLNPHARPHIGSLVVLALGGVPGNGFDLPLENHRLIAFSGKVVENPRILVQPRYRLQLPMTWLPYVFPVIKPFRVPARLALGVLLSAAVLAACALAAIRQQVQSQLGTNIASLLLAFISLAILFEYWTYPYPSFASRTHPFFVQIGHDHEKYAIAEAPLFIHPEPMRRQTVHGKPILLGNLSRAPREGVHMVNTNAILRLLTYDPADSEHRTILKHESQNWPQALTELRALKIRYIVVHKAQAPPVEQYAYHRVLGSILKLPLVLDDRELRVYRL